MSSDETFSQILNALKSARRHLLAQKNCAPELISGDRRRDTARRLRATRTSHGRRLTTTSPARAPTDGPSSGVANSLAEAAFREAWAAQR
jgi:hypothetical protein